MTRQFDRPVLKASEVFDRLVGVEDPADQFSLTHDTAWALLNRVRKQADPELVKRVIEVAQTHGIDEIAELWSGAHELSLPGLLWRLYLLYGVISQQPEHASHLFEAGVARSITIDPAVAGITEPISPESVRDLCYEILRGVFIGDFAVALDRAASTCSVLADGATELADTREGHFDESADMDGTKLTRQALRFDELSRQFRAGARAWRAGDMH